MPPAVPRGVRRDPVARSPWLGSAGRCRITSATLLDLDDEILQIRRADSWNGCCVRQRPGTQGTELLSSLERERTHLSVRKRFLERERAHATQLVGLRTLALEVAGILQLELSAHDRVARQIDAHADGTKQIVQRHVLSPRDV